MYNELGNCLMAKITPNKQYSSYNPFLDEDLQLNPAHQAELTALYEASASKFQVGKVVKGKILSKEGNGVLISIDYKSDGLIPNYEFSEYELKKLNWDEHGEKMYIFLSPGRYIERKIPCATSSRFNPSIYLPGDKNIYIFSPCSSQFRFL